MTSKNTNLNTNGVVAGLLFAAAFVVLAVGLLAENTLVVFVSVWVVGGGAWFGGRFISDRKLAAQEESTATSPETEE